MDNKKNNSAANTNQEVAKGVERNWEDADV